MISVASDRSDRVQGTVAWSLTDLAGGELARGDVPVDLPAGTATVQIADLDLREALVRAGRENVLLWLKLSVAGKTASENVLTFARPRALKLQDPAIDAQLAPTADGWDVTLTARHPALHAWIELANVDARYSDNFVPLRANEPITLHVATTNALNQEQFKAALRVRSLYDTYDPNALIDGEDHNVIQSEDGSFLATAAKAEVVGDVAALEDGGEYTVTAGTASLPGRVVTTKDWQEYTPVTLGEIHLDHPDDIPLIVRGTVKPNGFVMNLRSVRLVPKLVAPPIPTP